jgi:hypothetical protein
LGTSNDVVGIQVGLTYFTIVEISTATAANIVAGGGKYLLFSVTYFV